MNFKLLILLFMSLFVSTSVCASTDRAAVKYAGKALYKHLDLDKALKRLEKRHLSNDTRKYLGYTTSAVRIVTEKKVTYIWEF